MSDYTLELCNDANSVRRWRKFVSTKETSAIGYIAGEAIDILIAYIEKLEGDLSENLSTYKDHKQEFKQQLATARREGWELAKEESQRTIQQLEAMNKTLVEHISKGITLQPTPVMMADAAAHRMGWEQAKRECVEILQDYCKREMAAKGFGKGWQSLAADAIAAMEYGGEK